MLPAAIAATPSAVNKKESGRRRLRRPLCHVLKTTIPVIAPFTDGPENKQNNEFNKGDNT